MFACISHLKYKKIKINRKYTQRRKRRKHRKKKRRLHAIESTLYSTLGVDATVYVIFFVEHANELRQYLYMCTNECIIYNHDRACTSRSTKYTEKNGVVATRT